MLNRAVQVKTNLLTILIVCVLLVTFIVLYMTNGVQNLMFATITAGQIDAVTIHEQYGDRYATLSENDLKALSELLQDVRLSGRSVRLAAAEEINPQYSILLRNGTCFDIACYSDHYIINGRGYTAEGSNYSNYTAIGEQYLTCLENQEYFPREADGEDQT